MYCPLRLVAFYFKPINCGVRYEMSQPRCLGDKFTVGNIRPKLVESSHEHGGGGVLGVFSCLGWALWGREGCHSRPLRGAPNETAWLWQCCVVLWSLQERRTMSLWIVTVDEITWHPPEVVCGCFRKCGGTWAEVTHF